ncbi:hypothetical protein [Streptomyces sp. NRRL F-5123]|uniref:hypothetical protein n=1 Tax=Streptomyces sp. NRRL F-5123 TaxID=1463856 RepID=UPI0005BB0994|nr:hypothetical protein [Streptomyces sp. NRRL F-5123]
MTRETDSSSSGAQGRGGAAYPSGTQPYGSRPFPSLHPQERPRSADATDDGSGSVPGTGSASGTGPEPGAGEPPLPDEPRTETTLTTRIRINIPGSRPIPPVVVRTPVDEAAAAAPAEEAPEAEPEARPEPEPEKATSDWFSPRKPVAATEGAEEEAPPPAAEAPYAGGVPYLPPPVGGAPGEAEAARGPHDTPAQGFPAPFAGQAPPPPFGSPFDTGSVPRPPAPDTSPFAARSPYDTAAMPAADEGRSPYDTGSMPIPGGGPSPYDTGSSRLPGDAPSPYDTGSTRIPGGGPSPYDTGSSRLPGDAPSPYDTGSTRIPGGGPSPYDTGATPVVGDPQSPYDTGSHSPYDTGSQPFGTEDFPPGVPRPTASDPASASYTVPAFGDTLSPPDGPTAGPATGAMNVPPLTPDPAHTPPGGTGRVSGDTLVSGIPTVPPGGPRAPRPAAPRRPEPDREPEPAAKPAAPAPAAARPAKKGRSKPVLLGAGVVAVLVLAYGAGLLMNHADVPKGTTAFGVDIGNQNRAAAVKLLDDALGDRASAPLQLSIGGTRTTLKPSVAGLSVDTDATVRAVAHADYNPVSVIGSLFGGSRTASPVYVIDEDKLKAALQTLAGKGDGGSEGMVRFEDHKAIAVPGKARHTVDVDSAAQKIEAAYRTRVETAADPVVALDAGTVAPKVTQAELDRAVNGFGKTAMSGRVTVRADAAHFISFDNTLPQFLTMTADPEGKLAPHIDLVKLKELYGKAFKNVKLERGDGSKTAVTPQDVATALIQALHATDPAGRTVTFPNVAR